MLRPIDHFFLHREEGVRSCLQSLRNYILAQDKDVTEAWSYGMPFFYYRGNRFCYLWINKKLGKPYLGIVDGRKVKHPDLVMGKRSRMKIFYVEPAKNLPLRKLQSILRQAMALYDED